MSFVQSIPDAGQMAYYPRAGQNYVPGMIQVQPGTHPVALVIVLSILFGGWTGMLLNRQIAKGLVFGLLAGGLLTCFTFGIGALIWYPLTMIDAILVANKLNRGQAIKEWEFF